MVACLVLPSSHQTPAAWEAGGLLSGEPCGYPGVSLHLPLRRACCSPATALVTTGPDPHSDPRNSPVARQQKSDFLQTGGMVTDVCSGLPCTAP